MVNIFLDIDGVFADFEGYWCNRLKELGHTGDLDIDDADRELFKIEVADNMLFERLDLLPGAEELLSILRMVQDNDGVNIEMLSASGLDDSAHVRRVTDQKKVWLEKMGITYKANIVGRKQHKQLYVKGPDDIIIDDSVNTIHDWTNNGGTALLWHNDIAFEMAQTLKKILIEKGVI